MGKSTSFDNYPNKYPSVNNISFTDMNTLFMLISLLNYLIEICII